ncbi:MAG: DUF4340 domain-containing protein [Gammaproteobacteria bacterium]|nr:DUF4340 domain-containing protein [Gammaproteobacteria bacterium]
MSSRNILNLVLLATILVLVAVVFFKPGQIPEPVAIKLTTLSTTDITHILIERRNNSNIVLVKESGIWRMQEPYHLHANDFRVQSVLRLAEAESISQHDLSNLNPAEFALDAPEVSVTFNGNTKLDFGNTAALQQNRYISTNGKLHLAAESSSYHLMSKAENFLSHALLEPGAKIVKLELPELTLTLADGKWSRLPESPDISADATTELLNEWRSAQALELRPYENMTGQPVKIYLQDNDTPVELMAKMSDDNFILANKAAGIQYTLPEEKMAQLFKLPILVEPEEIEPVNPVTDDSIDASSQPAPATVRQVD